MGGRSLHRAHDMTDPWAGRTVLITGHTGFKGSWASLALHQLGAEVAGFSLPTPPTTPSLFEQARLDELVDHHTGDVRDPDSVHKVLADVRPDVVLHLAAQSLVRTSYADPITTFSTNVMGTVNVLDAARAVGLRGPVIVVTSDKVYRPAEDETAHTEDSPLGGADPYSGSKAATEVVVDSYVTAFASTGGTAISPLLAPVATARAGNVIGGGDWAADRLVPDLVRAATTATPLLVRAPDAVRPWQHVLDPIAGYLRLAEHLMRTAADGTTPAVRGWNFGPNSDDEWPVRRIADAFSDIWPEAPAWRVDERAQPRETPILRLDATAAMQQLDWRPRWDVATALRRSVEWYRAHASGADARRLMLDDLEEYRQ